MPKRDKPKRVIETHRDFMWPTSDDWHPTFERNTVRVRLSSQYLAGERSFYDRAGDGHEAFVRLSVWGADDDGMELDCYCSKADLPRVINEVGGIAREFPNPITKAWLTARGFVRA